MGLSEKLVHLRRKEGLSQEQLADLLGVTRQSVSKWESGTAVPELSKLIAVSERFGVSVDYLVKEWLEEPETARNGDTARLEEQVEDLTRYFRGYSFTSRTRVFGVPLISIRFARRRLGRDGVARGVIAVGNAAVGVVAIGAASLGVVSVGAFSAGLLALGALAVGVGALGAVSVGLVALGSCAVGVWSGGVAAVGQQIAVGVAAAAETAVGKDAVGQQVLLWGGGLSRSQVEAFLLEHHPDLWRPLLRTLSFFGAHIQ